jgi:signal peptide peptidase SppA
MNDPTFAAQLYSEPWAIMPSAFADLVRQVHDPSQRADDKVGHVHSSFGPVYSNQVELVGGVAIVPVHGVIGRHCSAFQQWIGMADTALLQEQLRNIRDDKDVDLVVLNLRTPGGLALGLEETAATIREVSAAGKPVIGYADSLCASAGYHLVAACDAVYADPSARVGSISTIMAGVDSSKAWEDAGYELKLFASGALKALGMGGKKWTEEEERHMEERLQHFDGQFKNFVRSRRPVSDEHMQGQVWQAKEVSGLLVDGFAETLPELVAGLLE